MNNHFPINCNNLVTVKRAAEVFGYSTDHITRLAKSKKVLATQVSRRWFVSEKSLQGYLETQRLESGIKKEHLSVARQRELSIRSELAQDSVRSQKLSGESSALTLAVSALFLCGAFLFIAQLEAWEAFSVNSSAASAQLLGSQGNTFSRTIENSETALSPVFLPESGVVMVSQERSVLAPEITAKWIKITP